MNAAVRESQTDSIIQPRVGEPARQTSMKSTASSAQPHTKATNKPSTKNAPSSVPPPQCPRWPHVWSQQTRVRVGDDGQVPGGRAFFPLLQPR